MTDLQKLAEETWEFIGNKIDQLDDHLTVAGATECYERIHSALEQVKDKFRPTIRRIHDIAHEKGWYGGDTQSALDYLAQQPRAEQDLLDIAWGIIANAGGGDWTKESKQWQEAAAKWRDDYKVLPAAPVPSEPPRAARNARIGANGNRRKSE